MLRDRSLILSNNSATIAPNAEQLENIFMYSPKIDKHTPNLYRLAKAVGKPMTKVADELILYGFNNLKSIYQLDDQKITEITQQNEQKSQNKFNF
ncbi:MAG: hypothetical protein GY820_46110 [Gammaproteobacteria bacterium]|nr:hypothetical protein [Gammaproteobacteria bacterium]